MKREFINYAIIGAGILIIVSLVTWQVWPEAGEPLDPPEVVAQRLSTGATKEDQIRAAQDFVRHGAAAREQIRSAIAQHESFDSEVVVPLAQAAMKSRDYRSLPVLVRLMRHEDEMVRGRAGAAAQRIMGADYGFRANLPEDERARIVAHIEEDVVLFQDRFAEVYGH